MVENRKIIPLCFTELGHHVMIMAMQFERPEKQFIHLYSNVKFGSFAFVTDELDLLHAYLSLESGRSYGHHRMQIVHDSRSHHHILPAGLLQSLVEGLFMAGRQFGASMRLRSYKDGLCISLRFNEPVGARSQKTPLTDYYRMELSRYYRLIHTGRRNRPGRFTLFLRGRTLRPRHTERRETSAVASVRSLIRPA